MIIQSKHPKSRLEANLFSRKNLSNFVTVFNLSGQI